MASPAVAALAVMRRSMLPRVVGRMRKDTGVPSCAGTLTVFLRKIASPETVMIYVHVCR